MTTLTFLRPASGEALAYRAWWAVKNTLVLTKRSIARIAREPEQLLDVTIQPVIFVLLFTYVFGSAIVLPGGGDYHEYLIGGMFGMSMAGTAPGTAVGISADMKSGLIDRFRSLPISRCRGAGRPGVVRPLHPGPGDRRPRSNRSRGGLADPQRATGRVGRRRPVPPHSLRHDVGGGVRRHAPRQS